MKLTIGERVNLIGILPDRGNIGQIRVLRELREKLDVTPEEVKVVNFAIKQTAKGAMATWDDKKDANKEVKLTDAEVGMLRDALRVANDNGNLTIATAPLYERFLEDKK